MARALVLCSQAGGDAAAQASFARGCFWKQGCDMLRALVNIVIVTGRFADLACRPKGKGGEMKA